MRSVSRVFWRTLALLLAFLLGFLTCVGAIFGAGFFIYEKVSFDTVNDNFTKLDTSQVFDKDNAEVVLTSLTIKQMIEEGKALSKLGDEVTIDLLVSRYGLKISKDVYKYLNEDLRQIPLFKLFSQEGIDSVLKSVTVGLIMSYDRVPNPDYTEGSDEPEYIWLNKGTEVTGINGILSDYSLYKLIHEGIDLQNFASELTVASVMDLYCKDNLPVYRYVDGALALVTDIEPIEVWYNSDGTKADKMIASVAKSNVLEIGDKFEGLALSDVLGYVEYNQEFYSYTVEIDNSSEFILLEKATGITAELADLSITELSQGKLDDKLDEIELSTVLGYTLTEDGKYLDNGEEVKGIMGVLAGKKIGEISSSVGDIQVGEVAGYTLVGETWYKVYDEEDPSKCVPASGVLGAMADLTVDKMTDESELSKKIETISIADALGYTLDPEKGKYYKDGELLTGVMAVVADTPIKDIQSKIDSSKTGELMGYEVELVDDFDEFGNPIKKEVWSKDGVAVHPIMNKVASTGFNELDGLPGSLVLGDVIPDDERTGLVSFIKPSTPINEIPDAVDDVFNNTTMQELVKKDVIKFEATETETAEERKQRFLNKEIANWTMPQIMDFMLDVPDEMLSSSETP